MKRLETILSFIVSLVGIIFSSRGSKEKRKSPPPCCPCPYLNEEEEEDTDYKSADSGNGD